MKQAEMEYYQKNNAAGKADATTTEETESENFDGDAEGYDGKADANSLNPKKEDNEETDVATLPTKNNQLYNTTEITRKLEQYPKLKIRRDGKYYMKMKDAIIERHPKLKRNSSGKIVGTIHKEKLGPIEHVISRFCEDVLCISRAMFLPLSSQGERHLIWVGKKKANHIIRHLNGNGCYVVNRFPSDIFLKDKQVMGITLRKHMLMKSNTCSDRDCGVSKSVFGTEKTENKKVTKKLCSHMVRSMRNDASGCKEKSCFNYEKACCKHLDIFIPEVQSFCTYNALQDFSNRLTLTDDLKGQTFVCKPAYLYKGFGFRFFRRPEEFKEFYHMTEGKETSRHDFMVQRLIDKPFLHNNFKFDIRAFLLVIVLRHRRVVSFIHYGFCRIARDRYEPDETDVEDDEKLNNEQSDKKKKEMLESDLRMHVCTYVTAEEKKKRKKLLADKKLLNQETDRSIELSEIFEEEEDLAKIQKEIRNIGIRITEAIENKVWDWFGCFQIFSLDLCVNEDLQVWLIEVNSHAMSEVDTLSPVQRKVVPAVIMEAIGLVMECVYKSFHNLRLRKNPENEFDNTGFLFRKNYEFIFSTLKRKRMDYVCPKQKTEKRLPYYERIGEVDKMIKKVEMRKRKCQQMKEAVKQEQLQLKRAREGKDEEES